MPYLKTFDPTIQDTGSTATPERKKGDRRDGEVYIYDDKTVLAVNVAIATGRPLLIYGVPGSGKSSLAPYVAKCLNWRFYQQIISSRTQARDMLSSFDVVRRLSDAYTPGKVIGHSAAYIEPGILWWAFNSESAMNRGLTSQQAAKLEIRSPRDPGLCAGRIPEHAVVLLDEIDKADPDVPNNLLVPLGSHQFPVEELGILIEAREPPLVFITTNDERELPKAFLRRCITLTLSSPDPVAVATKHFGVDGTKELYQTIAEHVQRISKDHRAKRLPEPSTAEYLDAVAACITLEITPGSGGDWDDVVTATLSKRAV